MLKPIFLNWYLNFIYIYCFLQITILPKSSIASSNFYLTNNPTYTLTHYDYTKKFIPISIYNDFTRNKPILKTYGPLILDINNYYYDSNIFIVPILNIDFKPLFLAINCKEAVFSIKNNSNWKDWFKPFFTYELNIFNDFCGS